MYEYLTKPAEDVWRLMKGLGFTTEHYSGGVNDVYYKASFLDYEMHMSLFGKSDEPQLYEYNQVKSGAINKIANN